MRGSVVGGCFSSYVDWSYRLLFLYGEVVECKSYPMEYDHAATVVYMKSSGD